MAANRFRLKFMFWLDVTKEDELALSEQIEELKQHRSYVKTIRDGIRLVCDLKQGSTHVLFELFPWLKTELVAASSVSTDTHLQQEIANLKQLILGQGSSLQPALSANSNGPKQLNVPKPSRPLIDDDDDQDTVVIRKNTSTNASKNFLNAMMGLQGQ
jgi:hypothetical protein